MVNHIYWQQTFASKDNNETNAKAKNGHYSRLNIDRKCSLMIQSAMEEVLQKKPEWLSPSDLTDFAESFFYDPDT